ncbi:MAG: MFS transporter, partial [Candidatus Bathyarchaeia archaeon]
VAGLNWRFALYLWAVGGLIVALIFAWSVREPDGSRHERLADPMEESRPSFTGSITSLTMAYTVYNVLAKGLSSFIPMYLVDVHGVPIVPAGMVSGLLLVSGAIGSLVGGYLADRFDKKRVILIMITLSTLFVCLITVLEINLLFLILVATLGVAIYSIAPTTQALIADVTVSSERAGIFGIVFTISVGAGALTPTVMGSIADAFGLGSSFYFLSAIAGIGMVSVLATR